MFADLFKGVLTSAVDGALNANAKRSQQHETQEFHAVNAPCDQFGNEVEAGNVTHNGQMFVWQNGRVGIKSNIAY